MSGQDTEYLDVFISESMDLLQAVSNDLLELESNPGDLDVVNRLFRSLHTLKGGASLDGLDKISTVAHYMEDIFGHVRDNELSIDPDNIDLFLEGNDVLQQLLEGIGGAAYDEIDNSEITAKLKKVYDELIPDKAQEAAGKDQELKLSADEIATLTGSSKNVYRITLRFDAADAMKNVNAFIVSNNLKQLAGFFKSLPEFGDLQGATFENLQIICESGESADKLKSTIVLNHPDFEVDLLDATGIGTLSDAPPPPKVEFGVIIQQNTDALLGHLKDGLSVLKIRLEFQADDMMKGIGSFIIHNNLSDKAALVLSSLTPDEFKSKMDMTELEFCCATKLSQTEAEALIKVNCANFTVQALTADDIAPPPPKKQEKKADAKKVEQAYLEVDRDILDGALSSIGEVVLNMNLIVNMHNDLVERDMQDLDELKMEYRMFDIQLNAVSMLCNSLMDYAMRLKLVPVNMVFKKFPRVVRDIAKTLGKKVKLVLEGEHTRIASEVLESLDAPLLHMIRNSMDHGIEPKEDRLKAGKSEVGQITLRAVPDENDKERVNIEIIDDGRGLDKEKLLAKALSKKLVTPEEAKKLSDAEIYAFIYNAGFSTAETVSKISGRGVGMDVVVTEIRSAGGNVTIFSEKGKGSRMVLNLPVT